MNLNYFKHVIMLNIINQEFLLKYQHKYLCLSTFYDAGEGMAESKTPLEQGEVGSVGCKACFHGFQ